MNESLRVLDANKRYVVGSIAWNDGKRGVAQSGGKPFLSPLGDNITDCCIITENGNPCQYIKPPNLDETIGVLEARHILVTNSNGNEVSLQSVLEDLPLKCKYMGYTDVNANVSENERVVVRCQASWVPIKKGTTHTKIVPQHYSFQTRSRSDPRNLLLLATPSGTFVHSDDVGGNKLFAHSVTDAQRVNTHWFEAKPNRSCKVGQASMKEDSCDASSEQNDSGVHIGIRGMGRRTNCFVTVAIPNRQVKRFSSTFSFSSIDLPNETNEGCVYRSLNACTGTSFSANVTVASESNGTTEMNRIAIVRPVDEPIVVTVLTYNTIEVPEDFEGDPTMVDVATLDVALGVADLDRQYDLIKQHGGVVCKLSELPAMLRTLTQEQVETILEKIQNDSIANADDPMVPKASALAAFI